MYSWPIVKFLWNGSPPSTEAGTPWRRISRSVAQIATASMRTRTSAAPGTGTGFSVRNNSSGPPRTQAFIRSGVGDSLDRGEAIARSSLEGLGDGIDIAELGRF